MGRTGNRLTTLEHSFTTRKWQLMFVLKPPLKSHLRVIIFLQIAEWFKISYILTIHLNSDCHLSQVKQEWEMETCREL